MRGLEFHNCEFRFGAKVAIDRKRIAEAAQPFLQIAHSLTNGAPMQHRAHIRTASGNDKASIRLTVPVALAVYSRRSKRPLRPPLILLVIVMMSSRSQVEFILRRFQYSQAILSESRGSWASSGLASRSIASA
jgi:hypothetical protein